MKVDRFYPSSKTCSNCGEVQEISLSQRVYMCKKCDYTAHRDLNASKNLEKYARLVSPLRCGGSLRCSKW